MSEVSVLDAQDPGFGASTRNHGHVGGIGKLPAQLETMLGKERAALMKEDAVRARNFLMNLIHGEKLDVDYVHNYADEQLGTTDRNLPESGPISATNPRPVPTFSTERPGVPRETAAMASAISRVSM